MPFNLGDTFPNFTADSYGCEGEFELYKYLEGSWGILFSHPADFTPVCTTELGKAAQLHSQFSAKNCKLVALSCNDVESHKGWVKDIMAYAKLEGDFPFPIVADPSRALATKLGIMDPDEKDKQGLPLTCRSVFFIGEDKSVKAIVLYPATTGRSFKELLRVLDSLQLTKEHPVATPEAWNSGDRCMVVPSLPTDEAMKMMNGKVETVSLPSGREYLRMTPDPRNS